MYSVGVASLLIPTEGPTDSVTGQRFGPVNNMKLNSW